MIEGPNWDDIRIFAAIAETGSLSAAARALGLSQPTVGRRLRALEDALGLRLVERVSNRLALTAAGERIRVRAATMTMGALEIVRAARAIDAGDGEPVRITATGSISLFLARHMGELLASAAPVPVAVEASKGRANLARRDADIAIRMRRLPEDGDLVARRVKRLAFTIYGPAGAEEAAIGRGVPIIGLPKSGSSVQSAFLDAWAGARPIAVRMGDVALRHQAVLSHRGATLLPCWLGDGDADLVRLIPPPEDLREDVFILVHRDLRALGPVAGVSRALADLFKAHAAALAGDSRAARPVSRSSDGAAERAS
ncbi:LysR family transcriptional regulator [Chelatococcus sp. SYSU_G07232]|uniref:LysR family transcriptional regulator n=1 Tax=Chelatococcus albus TaxID=3047466 RepID=A0ABT7AGR8_9HYPH|nr:LysR family transcriptional regulator [Chelatococcus sp. SYSU_G07232]MDJ1158566.1 LysR family transcriptional regulator [Chelatococcus sp. SYSU_G07232]